MLRKTGQSEVPGCGREMGNRGLDGSELGKVVEPVVTRHLSSWGGRSSLSLSGNQGQGDSGDCVPHSLSRPATGVLSGQLWHQPARAEHRVSLELVAEPINKGGGWRARVEEPCAWAGGCLACSGSLAQPLGT